MLIFQLRCFLIISQYLKELCCQPEKLPSLSIKTLFVNRAALPFAQSETNRFFLFRERKDRHSFYSNKLSQKKSNFFFANR